MRNEKKCFLWAARFFAKSIVSVISEPFLNYFNLKLSSGNAEVWSIFVFSHRLQTCQENPFRWERSNVTTKKGFCQLHLFVSQIWKSGEHKCKESDFSFSVAVQRWPPLERSPQSNTGRKIGHVAECFNMEYKSVISLSKSIEGITRAFMLASFNSIIQLPDRGWLNSLGWEENKLDLLPIFQRPHSSYL